MAHWLRISGPDWPAVYHNPNTKVQKTVKTPKRLLRQGLFVLCCCVCNHNRDEVCLSSTLMGFIAVISHEWSPASPCCKTGVINRWSQDQWSIVIVALLSSWWRSVIQWSRPIKSSLFVSYMCNYGWSRWRMTQSSRIEGFKLLPFLYPGLGLLVG